MDAGCFNSMMTTAAEIRRENLRILVSRDGLTATAHRFGKPDRQINDMVAGRKSFGEKVARAMEANYAPNLPRGWLDVPFEDGTPVALTSGQAGYPHEARLLTDPEVVENKRKPQLFNPQLSHVPLYAYPIVTLDELRGGVVVDRENKEFMAGRETDVCDREPGRHDFAVRTQDDSMNGGAQPIPAGTVVFIEATNEAAPGEIVLIQLGAGTPILRTLVEDGDGYQLMPSAQGMQGKALSAGFRLHGVAFSWNIRVRPVAGARQDLSL